MAGSLSKCEIAVIGVGFKGPGADNLEQLWMVLENGENKISEIPKDRWNSDAFYDSDTEATGKYYSRKAGLLSNPHEFDCSFFNISEIESEQMDPQQKFVLECTYRAMEHAGITRDKIKGSKTGVFIGAMNCDYRGMFPARSAGVSNYTVTGISNSIIASRVSFTFDLRGPCLVLDTGCSSALIAIHTASHALTLGDCSMAICGGTNFMATPDVFVHLSKAQMLSRSGQCHAFSDQADGYTRGEGCGIVILKKLSDAERDNDPILAVITTGTNQDGHTVTPISAPSMSQQIQLLEEMYRDLSLEQLDEIEYIEAHGTGTQAGDYAEANALGQFYKNKGSSKKRLIGSIKTNIGHLESAAGAAGLIKVILMMEHNKIVPSLFSERPNKRINFDDLNLVVPPKVREWSTEKKVACVNSFGFGGSNCHAIVRSYKAPNSGQHKSRQCEKKMCIVCFSGKTVESLKGSLKDFLNFSCIEALDIHDVSFTSTVRRSHYKYRRAFVADSMKELMESLRLEAEQVNASRMIKNTSIVFVFGGMGTSWNGMCRELLTESQTFVTVINEIEECLKAYVNWSLKQKLNEGIDPNDPLLSPIAIFACQVGLAKVWQSLGIKPTFVVGQSVGEVAAAYTADHLSLQDAVKVIYKRSLLLSKVVGGNMFIVRNMNVKDVKKEIECYHGKATVSVEYSPVSCAISSISENVEEIKTKLQKNARSQGQDVTFTDLHVPTAYHSQRMDCIKEELFQELISIHPREASSCLMISTVTGDQLQGQLDAGYWAENLREPVRFYDAIRHTYNANQNNLYIEISPRPVLKAHMQDIFKEENVEIFTSMTPMREWRCFLQSVAELYSQGVDIDWTKFSNYGRAVTPVPRYCLINKSGYYKSEAGHLALSGVNTLRLEHPYVYKVNSTESLVQISPETFGSVYDHRISNMLFLPGAFYPEIGFALSKLHSGMNAPLYSVSAQFEQPFNLPREGVTVLKIECTKVLTSHMETQVHESYTTLIQHEGKTYATLKLEPLSSRPQIPPENIQFLKGKCTQGVLKKDIYMFLKQYGFTYGPRYSLLEEAQKCDNQCLAQIVIPDSLAQELPGTTLHPSIIDAMMQASVILLDDKEKTKELFPRSIASLVCYREIESKMFVIATKKGKDGYLSYYDIKLTTLEGQVIAVMKNLSHKTLSSEEDSTEGFYKCVWSKKSQINCKENDKEPKVLFITDFVPTNTPEYVKNNCITFSLKDQPSDVLSNNVAKKTDSFDFVVVLLLKCDIKESEDGDVVQEKVLNLCLFLQQLYSWAFSERLQKTIFIMTKDAVALEVDKGEGNALESSINPILTSAWGMLRCVLREPLYEDVIAIDLHMPQKDISLLSIAALADTINSDPKLKAYPEFIVTEKEMYVNQIAKLGKDTRVPNFRLNHTDNNTDYLILSSNSSTLERTICVYNSLPDLNQTKETHVEITISESAIHHYDLYHLYLPYTDERYSETGKEIKPANIAEEGFWLHVLESSGQLRSDSNQTRNVVCCFPTPLSSKVKVPKDTIIDTNMLRQYKPGDLTKIIVLFSLCLRVKTNTVTVLASDTTFHLAQCLIIMLKTFDSTIKVDVLRIEQLHKKVEIEETVVSLILTDARIISTIASMSRKPKHFVTVYSLMEEVMTLFSVKLPTTQLDLLDQKHLLSPHNLTTLVPQINEWITKYKSETDTLLQCIHEQDQSHKSHVTGALDLGRLLNVEIYKMTNGYVRAGKSDFFRKEGVYLVVGGLTGLGCLTVRFLAESGAGGVAILNRRAATEKQKTDILELSKSNNCLIQDFVGDCSKFDVLKNVFTEITNKFPNKVLRGVFFSAAVLEDKPLLELSRDDFYNVLLPKVQGAWNVHLLTKSLPLDYFVLYSSVTSIIGNINQTNYGAGNAFLDGLAFYRRANGLAAQSVTWGTLDLGLLEGNEEAKKKLESKGFLIMSKEDTYEAMTPVLLFDMPLIMPCQLDEKVILERRAADTPLRLQSRLESIFHWSSTESVRVQDDILRQLNEVREKTRDQRLFVFENYICNLASQVLSLPDGTLKPDSSVGDFGFDSIVAMTMTNNIYRQTGCRLHVILFLNGQSTIRDIAVRMDELFMNNQQPEV
ncbi:uncharacterized protein LOC106056651 [Biomphalaria glabrata]|uniref:Fatty acid synthase n=1 Tax=Biomphalaria glabrata TaxID=6526 RepID=A0A9W3B898_BIOGL|nr:uncharacterized protein LOC106056651 [Biomphalaria glabrata]XP_055895702.1 uncharacterized protein LOC106056651 [Biomphalaria glabrata]